MPSIQNISKESVLNAVAEFDKLGRKEFLKKYGYGKAQSFFLLVGKNSYDSKAIVGAAYGYEYQSEGPLSNQQFSGGEETVARLLEKLGFFMLKGESTGALILAENEVTVSTDDNYDDQTGVQYNYPKNYVNIIKPGLPFIYYKGVRRAGGKRGQPEYFGKGTIGEIWQDPNQPEDTPKKDIRWYCSIENYEVFKNPVPTGKGQHTYEEIERPRDLTVSVRKISKDIYESILAAAESEPVKKSTNTSKNKSSEPAETLEPGKLDLTKAFLRKPKAKGKRKGDPGTPNYSKNAKETGDWCEEQVYKQLKKTLSEKEAKSLDWLAQRGETPGWDIEYKDDQGILQKIEVKGTKASQFSSIEITANEWSAAEKYGKEFSLALVTKALSKQCFIAYIPDPFQHFSEQNNFIVEPARFRISGTL